jgi:hypothetical protein
MKNKSKREDKKLPRLIGLIPHQTGYRKDIFADAARNAMGPGKRLSKNNRVYWETRQNRSDAPGKRI